MPKLTKEQMESAFGLLPMTTTYEHRFTPKSLEKLDKAIKPVFIIKQLGDNEMTLLKTVAVTGDTKGKKLTASKAIKANDEQVSLIQDICEECILDWENLYNIANGEEIRRKGTKASVLPINTLGAIFTEILKISGLA